jgi:hypothetical protein
MERHDSAASFATAFEDPLPDAMDVDGDVVDVDEPVGSTPGPSDSHRAPPSGNRADSPILIDTSSASPDRPRFGKRRFEDIESTPSRDIFAESLFSSPEPEPVEPPWKTFRFTPCNPRQLIDCIEIPVLRGRPLPAPVPAPVERVPSVEALPPVAKPPTARRTKPPAARRTKTPTPVVGRGPRRAVRGTRTPVAPDAGMDAAPSAEPAPEPVASSSRARPRTTSFIHLSSSPEPNIAPSRGTSVTPAQVLEWLHQPREREAIDLTSDSSDGRFADAEEEWGDFRGL